MVMVVVVVVMLGMSQQLTLLHLFPLILKSLLFGLFGLHKDLSQRLVVLVGLFLRSTMLFLQLEDLPSQAAVNTQNTTQNQCGWQ